MLSGKFSLYITSSKIFKILKGFSLVKSNLYITSSRIFKILKGFSLVKSNLLLGLII